MTKFHISAKFTLDHAEAKEAARRDVEDAILAELQARGYIVAEGRVEVRVSEPRPRRGAR
jgi:hypothetical protein